MRGNVGAKVMRRRDVVRAGLAGLLITVLAGCESSTSSVPQTFSTDILPFSTTRDVEVTDLGNLGGSAAASRTTSTLAHPLGIRNKAHP